MLLGALSLILGPLLIREHVKRMFQNTPWWVLPTVVCVFTATIFALVLISVISGRAVSIDRLATVEVGADMRNLGLPTVLEIIRASFPFGVGVGGFDPAFRISEPDNILELRYFNHVHNDWLELVLEGGVLSVGVMVAALSWWIRASLRVWRRSKIASHVHIIGRLGSTMILLILLASASDYPGRTPLIMAVIVIAACWLSWGEYAVRDGASLPGDSRSL